MPESETDSKKVLQRGEFVLGSCIEEINESSSVGRAIQEGATLQEDVAEARRAHEQRGGRVVRGDRQVDKTPEKDA